MDSVSKTFHTLRYLKLSQIFYRGYYRLFEPKIIENKQFQTRGVIDAWGSLAYKPPATVDGKTFTFLGQTSKLDKDWNAPTFTQLWLYNLHYQDDLNAVGARDRTELLDSLISAWVKGNPALQGNGWEPYCISLRVVNWIKWFCQKPAENVSEHWVSSLGVQVGVLEQLLERHILANHLFANAKALVFAGAYFGGCDGERWLKGARSTRFGD